MRIAFASCIASNVFSDQPVWDWIKAQAPDHLVLLGDSVYLDIRFPGGQHPNTLADADFAKLAHDRYSELVGQKQFKGLVQSMGKGKVWSIWDDHDFLWDDAFGADARESVLHASKVQISTSLQEALRQALGNGLAAGSFPSTLGPFPKPGGAGSVLATPSIPLSKDVWLHLGDVRSWRTKTWLVADKDKTILGKAQRALFQTAIQAHPDAIHLFASGSTCADYKKYDTDWAWLLGLAAKQRLLVLSGDIHRNDSDAFFTRGLPLHEATSSGAAVRTAVEVGKTLRNYGLVDIDDSTVSFSLFSDNRLDKQLSRTLSRSTWLPI